MKTFHNPDHAAHAGQHEMFRGRLVACHEVPARLTHVLDALNQRPLGPMLAPQVPAETLDSDVDS